MSLIHPFQSAVLNSAEDLLFAVVKNEVVVFRRSEGSEEYTLAGKWVDELAKDPPRSTSEETSDLKKSKGHDGTPIPTKSKGQPPATVVPTNLLRSMTFSPDESMLLICADSDKSVCVLRIDSDKKELNLIKRQAFPKRPNAIAALENGSQIVVADKFGDVYQIPMLEDTHGKVGKELQPLVGHVSMLTDVLFGKDDQGRNYLITSDRDEHIRVTHYPQTFVIDKWLFGHTEFVSCMHTPFWHSHWLFSVGGDDTIFLWDWVKGSKLSVFEYKDVIKPYLTDAHLAASRFQNENNDLIEYSVAKITTCRKFPYAAFFVEATKALIILHVDQTNATLSLKQIIDLRYNVISLSQVSDGFLVTLDNRESDNKEFIRLIRYVESRDTFELDRKFGEALDDAINKSLNEDSTANVHPADIAPLYGVTNLKKHDEQYS
ncbi:tRNA (guanine-N(7)-)-methyltransferase non-catalytic subunit trm82 [Zygosaccharomyces mellis]|uniref:tRNA (Guanine-N(7)-)-methyltransferase non-catalytic subunit trm82 n=1 Tax=Zygosaccharomyces mellis TaxID=42258 RepID=A0A4C2EDB3_9SACH|nr:tRNA (guanine-N(7)-)-methyltransferase non-catalytic subunit trm82 [Zygosaccharomyces mellis]